MTGLELNALGAVIVFLVGMLGGIIVTVRVSVVMSRRHHRHDPENPEEVNHDSG